MAFAYKLAAEPLSEISRDTARIAASIAAGLYIGTDKSIQGYLRDLAGVPGRGPFLVKKSHIYRELVESNVKVHRGEIRNLPTIDLDALLFGNPEFASNLSESIFRSSAADEADRMILPFMSAESVPTRRQYVAIQPWQPAFEHLAYRIGTVAAGLLDLIRPQVRSQSGTVYPSWLATYWAGMTLIGHATFLACDPAARPWLSEMANQFVWTNWTPTFPLVRERTMWLAAVAARSAIAFGAPVIGKYLDALSRASEPMKTFDALFGLAAIALSDFAAAPAILKEIRSQRALTVDNSPYVARMYDDAIAVISAVGETSQLDQRLLDQLGWSLDGQGGLATKAALTIDPTRITHTGRFLGFAVLPKLIAARAEDYFPASGNTKRQLRVSNLAVSRIISRAWG